MLGPGKYDEACTKARELTKAEGAVLIIYNGEFGHGFSAQLTIPAVSALPKVLRQIADQIERDEIRATG